MAFVLEKIPEEDKKKYGLELESVWPIDHKRNAVLVHSGGVPEAKFYDLYWKDRIIRIEVKGNSNLVENVFCKDDFGKDLAYGVYDTDFHFYNVKIPESLRKDKDTIKCMIGEALTLVGFSGDPKRNRNITLKNLDDTVIKYVEQTSSEKKLQRKQLIR